MATKEQVQFVVSRLLRLRNPPSPADAADGAACALAHFMSARLPKPSALSTLVAGGGPLKRARGVGKGKL